MLNLKPSETKESQILRSKTQDLRPEYEKKFTDTGFFSGFSLADSQIRPDRISLLNMAIASMNIDEKIQSIKVRHFKIAFLQDPVASNRDIDGRFAGGYSYSKTFDGLPTPYMVGVPMVAVGKSIGIPISIEDSICIQGKQWASYSGTINGAVIVIYLECEINDKPIRVMVVRPQRLDFNLQTHLNQVAGEMVDQFSNDVRRGVATVLSLQ